MQKLDNLVTSYQQALAGMPVSHVWMGYGTALFIEFGELSPAIRRDGSPGNGKGLFGLGIEWGWRIETASAILCGSDSDADTWRASFDKLIGQRVTGLNFIGRLPELELHLTGDLHLMTFMPTEGQPEWAVFDRRSAPERWLHVVEGQIVEGMSLAN